MFKVTYAFEIVHIICVYSVVLSQTLASQPQRRPWHFVSLFFICSTHNPQPPFHPQMEKRMKKNNNNLYFLWNCWSHLWLHWRGRVKPLKWHGDRSCVTLQRVWKKLENWAAQPPHPPSGGEEKKKNTKPTSTRRMVNTSTQRLPRSPLGLPPDPNTDSSLATTRPMITLFPLSRSEGLINALICKWVPQ